MKRINSTRHEVRQLLFRKPFIETYYNDLVERRAKGERITEEDLFDELYDELFEFGGAVCFPSFMAFRLYCRRHGYAWKPADIEKARRKAKGDRKTLRW